MKKAQKIVKERLIINAKSISQAFKKVDADGSGTLSRDEIMEMLNSYYILKYQVPPPPLTPSSSTGLSSGSLVMHLLSAPALSNRTLSRMLQDFYTKEIRGDCTVDQIHALLDLVDTDGDGAIKYMEFARILSLDDLAAYVLELQSGKKKKAPIDKAVIR